MMMINNYEIEGLIQSIVRQQEAYIAEQLGELIQKGLLVIESTKPILTQEFSSNKIHVSQAIRLVLKDKEYIEALESENKQLKSRLEQISNAIQGIEGRV